MINPILLFTGFILITLWGIAHIVPTKPVVEGFGQISEDNRRIVTMGWIAEGLTPCFIGLLVLPVAISVGTRNPVSVIVYRASALMLIVMAGLSLLTGARTSVLPMKICPFVKLLVAVMFFLGSVI